MRHKVFFRVSVLLVSIALLFGCATTGIMQEEAKEDFSLKMIETSDAHGMIFPYDFINDEQAPTSLAHVSSYVKEQRAVDGQEVLLFDNGDILQGQPIVYYYNFEKTEPTHIQARVMNYMGYDAGTVGNHDIEAGHPVYDKIDKEFNHPWLAANAVDKDTGEPYFTPYTTFTRKGAKIAVLGMITPGIPNWLPQDIWKGIRFEGMKETAEKWIPRIQEQEKPDIIVGLFHAGVDSSYGSGEGIIENASLLVAKEVPGFDVIFTGHDHKDTDMEVEGPTGSTVHVIGALDDARSVATATVEFDYSEKSGEYTTSVDGKTVMLKTKQPDQMFLNEFADAKQEVKDWVSEPIGRFTKTISTRNAMFADSAFVDLIHNVQMDITDADVSFAAPLSFDATIEQGQIRVRDMFNLYKYENLLYKMELTGKQIKDYLEYSYGGWMNTMEGPDSHMINFQTDEKGGLIWNDRYESYDLVTRYYNYDSAAGIEYTVDLSKEQGNRITIDGFTDGRPFNMDETYVVAINSYRGNGGGGHLTKGAGLPGDQLDEYVKSSTVKDLRYLLMKWIEERGTVEPQANNNWEVVPEDWVEQARETDYGLLFEGERVE
ncbi:MAG: bifunctional metallophosphatase/5'-nucleotidase [Spirochaetia bacterium]|nr:bifunctional metallophosphatase/5'-nucleotidase [Spirochaetia bacterium]